MKSNTSLTVFIVLQCLVLGQIIAALIDGRLYHGQMRRRGIGGYSLTDHGGIWFDLIFMSYLIAEVIGEYRLDYLSWYGLLTLAIVVLAIIIAGYGYSKAAAGFGEAHSHDGKTTVAGWLHGLYALGVAWVLALFYLSPASPAVTARDLIYVSGVLTPFFFIGVVKFNSHWRFDRVTRLQTFGGPLLVWAVTAVKLWLMRKQ